MNAVEVYNTTNNYLTDLINTYGDDIEYLEAYDGKIIVHFKKDYVEEKIAEAFLKDFIDKFFDNVMGWVNDE